MKIDYSVLSAAITHYGNYGYTQVEVPWIADSDTLYATIPTDLNHDPVMWVPNMNGGLVGSAEQGFVQLRHSLPRKPLMSVSPCFRRGDNKSPLHREMFMKLELHDNSEERDVSAMIEAALGFFRKFVHPVVAKTPEGFDITDENGVELGSYGERSHDGYSWVYGTGVALPRLSSIIA